MVDVYIPTMRRANKKCSAKKEIQRLNTMLRVSALSDYDRQYIARTIDYLKTEYGV